MTYFTYIHIVALAGVFVLFLAMLFMLLRKQNTIRGAMTAIGASIVGLALLSAFFMLVIDEYTKKAKVYNIRQTRVLMNESLAISGTIQNTGGFKLTGCTITFKLVNSPAALKDVDPDIFKPKGFWESLWTKRKAKGEIGSIEQEFKIAQGLEPGRAAPFTVYMRYPAKFQSPTLHWTLSCH